jgi:uncharacterized tellurite resistance protein B-like protein
MLKSVMRFLETTFAADDDAQQATATEQDLRLAIAVLLVEMSRADFVADAAEADALTSILTRHFQLEREEAETLMGQAGEQADEMVSLQQYTRAIHENLSEPQKHRLIEMLLEVALADGHFDKHERHLLNKIADLIYLRRADYVVIRDRMVSAAGASDSE